MCAQTLAKPGSQGKTFHLLGQICAVTHMLFSSLKKARAGDIFPCPICLLFCVPPRHGDEGVTSKNTISNGASS